MSIVTKEVMEQIADELAMGKSLVKICKSKEDAKLQVYH